MPRHVFVPMLQTVRLERGWRAKMGREVSKKRRGEGRVDGWVGAGRRANKAVGERESGLQWMGTVRVD